MVTETDGEGVVTTSVTAGVPYLRSPRNNCNAATTASLCPMDFVTIPTTQNVRVDYELGGIMLRIGAFLLDAVIYVVLYWVMALIVIYYMSVFDDGAVIFFGAIFLFLTYYFLAELFFRGQTLGKRIVGLRVIRLDGRDPLPADFLTRAVFLLPDALLTLGLPAILLIVTGRQNQRLGDMVANTAVIKTSVHNPLSLAEIMGIANREGYEPMFPGVQRFTNGDMLIVKNTLERSRRHTNKAHRQAVSLLANRIADELDLDNTKMNIRPEKFLEVVLMDYIVLTR